ncbi:MAG: hypothetical protein MJE68_03320 [Proteobacteria bacterium]|nr:hypothetical protein [Pseudomonadota bacterium]
MILNISTLYFFTSGWLINNGGHLLCIKELVKGVTIHPIHPPPPPPIRP